MLIMNTSFSAETQGMLQAERGNYKREGDKTREDPMKDLK